VLKERNQFWTVAQFAPRIWLFWVINLHSTPKRIFWRGWRISWS
jgi:hypothetical protein